MTDTVAKLQQRAKALRDLAAEPDRTAREIAILHRVAAVLEAAAIPWFPLARRRLPRRPASLVVAQRQAARS